MPIQKLDSSLQVFCITLQVPLTPSKQKEGNSTNSKICIFAPCSPHSKWDVTLPIKNLACSSCCKKFSICLAQKRSIFIVNFPISSHQDYAKKRITKLVLKLTSSSTSMSRAVTMLWDIYYHLRVLFAIRALGTTLVIFSTVEFCTNEGNWLIAPALWNCRFHFSSLKRSEEQLYH